MDRALLELQVEWGADEGLLASPRDRLGVVAAVVVPTPVPAAMVPVGVPKGAEQRAVEAAAACGTLAELREALGRLDCALADTAMHLVFGEGPEQPRIMLVGDCPGEEEDRTGRPYAGKAGGLLTRMLASIGVSREEVRVVQAIAWRPPGNRPPSVLERAMGAPFLRRQIALCHPERLVLLGGKAAATLLGGTPAVLRRQRGTWQDVAVEGLERPVPALLTHAPEQLLLNPALKREAWADLIALRQALDGGSITKP